MKNIKFKTQIYTTIEQSKRLLELGLDVQTSDCYHYAIQYFDGVSYENTGKIAIGLRSNIADENHFDYLLESFGLDDTDCFIPAWSLHRLIAMLPFKTNLNSNMSRRLRILPSTDNNFIVTYKEYEVVENLSLYDSIISIIEKVIKDGCFNKEYLKEE